MALIHVAIIFTLIVMSFNNLAVTVRYFSMHFSYMFLICSLVTNIPLLLSKVVGPLTSSYPAGGGAAGGASGPFSWVPQQMLSEDAAEEEGDSEGDSDQGEEERGEGDEAELVIDIPNE